MVGGDEVLKKNTFTVSLAAEYTNYTSLNNSKLSVNRIIIVMN